MKFFCFFVFLGFVVSLSKKDTIWGLSQGSFMMMGFMLLLFFELKNEVSGLYKDWLSGVMILLVVWVCFLLLYAMSSIRNNFFFSMFLLALVVLSFISLLFFFMVNYVVYFYIWFEAGMLGTLLMIIYYGSQPERWRASLYLVLYTLFGSIPFLISIVFLEGSLSWKFLFFMDFVKMEFYYLLGLGVLISFFVKLPMFGLHLWLPKAHVEAPIGGSMLLAGVLLKLGGYGISRFFFFLSMSMSKLMYMMLSWGLLGSLMCMIITFRQSDLKCYIAYSSVVHMSLLVAGLLVGSSMGSRGCIMMMLSHGLVSCSLFCVANFMYERGGSRSVFLVSSMLRFLSCGVLLWSLCILCNLGMPPLMSFYSEFMIFFGILFNIGSFSFFVCFLCFLISGLITMYYFVLCYHGELVESMGLEMFSMREFMLCWSMFWPIGFGGFFLSFFF